MFGVEKYRKWLRHPGYNLGGGGGGGTQTTTQKADPWSGVQPYLTSAYSQAQQLYENQPGPQLYGGQTYVSPSALTLESRGALEDYARGQMGQDIAGARGAYSTLLGAADVNQNPYLYQAAMGATRPVVEQLTENILPSIRSSAVNTGQYGGSRQALAEGTAIGKAAQAMGDITSGMYSNAYQQGLGTLQSALGMTPQMMALSQAPAQAIGQLGQAQEADQAKQLQEDIQRWDYSQNLPYQQLSNYLNLLQGASPYATSTSTQRQAGGGSDVMGGLGAALSIASMFASDRRVKEDIKQVGTTNEGLPVYTFRYKWGGPVQMGVMAQDVEKIKPEAVAEVNGLKMVNYSMIH